MKVSEQLQLLLSGKVTYEQLQELKKEEEIEKNEPQQDDGTEPPQDDEKDTQNAIKLLQEENEKLKEQIAKLQSDNVHGNNEGDIEDDETALLNIFKNM